MVTAAAYAATSADGPLEKTTVERRELGPLDILIDIKFAGICHSDIHTARNEWGGAKYPIVPGHEIAGVVAAVGSDVTKHKVGDRVGVGCFVDSCGECDACTAGEEQYCRKGVTGTYNATDRDGERTQGGYSTHIVVTEHFVLSIPEGIELDVAAPLLCAGITLYSPLRHWNAGPGKKVAIIGFGGLGHVGVKIAKATESARGDLAPAPPVEAQGKRGKANLTDLIALSVEKATRSVMPAMVLVPTLSGESARSVARFRLEAWIIAVSTQEDTCRRLLFSYGVYPTHVDREPDDWNPFARHWVESHGLDGALAILTRGPSPENPGANHRMPGCRLQE